MAGNSKACFTVISYEENMNFFETSIEKEFDYWYSQKASGIAIGMHHREVDDKNHDHWMIGWSKSAPSTSDFVQLLKARNAELIASAKASGKDVTITLDDGSTVERQFYKIYTGRYANKHCVFNPEALNDYLSHSTKKAQQENKVQYDPDKDVIYSDGFDLDAYLSRDAVAKAKKEEQKDDVLLMLDLFKMVRETGITNIIDLACYAEAIGRMDLLAYMHAHSATIHFAIADEYRDTQYGRVPYDKIQECKQKYPHGTNSVDAGQIPPKNDDISDPGCAAQEVPFVDAPAADAPAEDAPADAPASTDAEPCVESKDADSTYARGVAPEGDDSAQPAEGASRKAREADTIVSPSILKLLAEDDIEVSDSDEIAALFDDDDPFHAELDTIDEAWFPFA